MSSNILPILLSLVVLLVIGLVILSLKGPITNKFTPPSPSPNPVISDSVQSVSTVTSIKTALLTHWRLTTAGVIVIIIAMALSIILPILLNSTEAVDQEIKADLEADAEPKEESFWSVGKVSALVAVLIAVITVGIFIAEARVYSSRDRMHSSRDDHEKYFEHFKNGGGGDVCY